MSWASAGNRDGHDPHSGKVLYFEWARCLAAAMVVLIHVTSGIMDNYTVAEVGTARALVWSELQVAFMRWAVPVFLMITGALLLDPAKPAGWKKVGGYVKRMALVLCTFGFAFCLMKEYFAYRALTPEMLGQSVLDLLSNDGFSHMWYVYALIGIYLLLPVFKAFVAAAGKRELEVLLAILFAFTCVVPTVNSAFGLQISTFVWLTSSAFYVFLGHYAHNYMELGRGIVAIGLVALAACMGLKAYGIVALGEYCKFLHGPASFMEALWSLLVFLLMKRFLDRPYAEGGGSGHPLQPELRHLHRASPVHKRTLQGARVGALDDASRRLRAFGVGDRLLWLGGARVGVQKVPSLAGAYLGRGWCNC